MEHAIKFAGTRLTRQQSQERTRRRILDAARRLFRTEGYSQTSVDRVADAAGYSKGALYSNFESKEALLLAVLDTARQSFDDLLAAVGAAHDAAAITDLLAAWADDCSRNGNWILAILEHVRSAGADAPSVRAQETMLRDNWRQLGAAVLARFPAIEADPVTLGALLHEIAYAPAMTLVATPTAGDMMRLALAGLLRHKTSMSPKSVE